MWNAPARNVEAHSAPRKVSMIANFQAREPASKLAQELAKRCDGRTQAVLSWVGSLVVFDVDAGPPDRNSVGRGTLQWFACDTTDDRRFWVSGCSGRDLELAAGTLERLLKP